MPKPIHRKTPTERNASVLASEIAVPLIEGLTAAFENMPLERINAVRRIWSDPNFVYNLTSRPEMLRRWLDIGEDWDKAHHNTVNIDTMLLFAVDLLRSRESVKSDDVALDAVTRIGSNLADLQAIHTSLNAVLSSGRKVHVDEFDLGEVIDTSLKVAFLDATSPSGLREKVNVSVEIDPNLPKINSDEHRILMVLNNVLSNSVQAIEWADPTYGGGGSISITAKEKKMPEGEFVEVAVTDSGIGFDPQEKEKLFEPFYTTKGNMGTGLGLVTNREIMEYDLGGAFDLKSEGKGKGATASILIPLKLKE
ncbi:MAG: ATP-binding protein [Methanobacteriota archaeon]